DVLLLLFFRLAARAHAVKKLPHQPERVGLIVMDANWKAHKLRNQVRQERRVLVNVEAIHRHAATNGLRPDRLVAPSGETLASDVCAPLQHTLDEEWPNAALDLPCLFSPADRLPFQNQVTECLDPHIRRGLPAPEIE